ncbi:MAG: Ldh family oxidoreductase [Nitrospinota bacterium]|nr:Ldh family oxidoreductase [Nitrospinota bacterium]
MMPSSFFKYKSLFTFIENVFTALGVSQSNSKKCAAQTLDAELRGVTSHGCVRLISFAERLKKKTANPKPKIKTIVDLPSYSLLDGDHGLSAIVGERTMKTAFKKAKDSGFGAAAVRNSLHTGHVGYFAAMALKKNMIGIVISGAVGNLAPWGGSERLIGNNPIAFAIPSNQKFPIIFDIATSRVARGYVMLAAKAGEKIPKGWALDKLGKSTTNPNEALKGTMVPLGGHKGYGLALMFSFLTATLSGNTFDGDRPDWLETDEICSLPMLCIAIDPRQCLGKEYESRVDAVVEKIKKSSLAPGYDQILIPGEGSNKKYVENLKNGLQLNKKLVLEMNELALELGIKKLDS